MRAGAMIGCHRCRHSLTRSQSTTGPPSRLSRSGGNNASFAFADRATMEMAMAMTMAMAMAAGVVTMFGDGQTLELFALTMYDMCKYPNAQFTITGNGTPISSTGTHYQYCPFFDPTSGIFPFGTGPKPAMSFIGPRTETGLYACGPISGTGLCQFRCGHSLGPVPKLDYMRVVPFPGRGSASSATVIHSVPYQNWTICVVGTPVGVFVV